MAVSWTTLSNATVAAGAAVTTSLMTALRDNPEGIAQRASGAPKIFGVAYNYQEFTSSGTWTKPANAESGDIVIVWGVGGGGSGARDTTADTGQGGGGGVGALWRIDDIDDLGATEPVVVGAGAAGVASGNGAKGGNSSFGTSGNIGYCRFDGGHAGAANSGLNQNTLVAYSSVASGNVTLQYKEGLGGNDTIPGGGAGGSSHWGGGGGGRNTNTSPNNLGGFSAVGGHGGAGALGNGQNGAFPGGGGGATRDGTSGSGANGVVRVWCIKEA